MKKSLKLWQTVGFLFTSVTGVLLHFLYEWSGYSSLVAPFSGVNESTWEHMKLLFFPLFIFAIIQSRFMEKDYKNYWCIKLFGTLTGLTLIPLLFYTYQGILGVNADWFNIAIFFISAAIVFLLETHIFKSEKNLCPSPVLALTILCIIALLFVVFTFTPPQIPLFQDPVNGNYGILND